MTSACSSVGYASSYVNPVMQVQRKPAEQQNAQQTGAVQSGQPTPTLAPRTTIGTLDLLA